jgi:hypothetical protein
MSTVPRSRRHREARAILRRHHREVTAEKRIVKERLAKLISVGVSPAFAGSRRI